MLERELLCLWSALDMLVGADDRGGIAALNTLAHGEYTSWEKAD